MCVLVYRARPFYRYVGSGRGETLQEKGLTQVTAEAKLIADDHARYTQ